MRGWGVFTLADVVAARDRMIADPDFSPGMKQLVDAREVQEVKITAAEARQFASLTCEFSCHSQYRCGWGMGCKTHYEFRYKFLGKS